MQWDIKKKAAPRDVAPTYHYNRPVEEALYANCQKRSDGSQAIVRVLHRLEFAFGRMHWIIWTVSYLDVCGIEC